MSTRIASLHIYPVKSCGGIAVESAKVAATGLEFDRHWMLINEHGRFVTQREQPRLALIKTELIFSDSHLPTLRLRAPGMDVLSVTPQENYPDVRVTVWRDTLPAQDEGTTVATWFSEFLRAKVRLVRFHPHSQRKSSTEWTGEDIALNEFSDGYSMLAISEASLADLNSRLSTPLPMNRFRPNIVLSGLNAYDEDRISVMRGAVVHLRVVKPCTRCKITTTEQSTGEVQGEEPLTTLKTYRWSEQLRGVTFGQNIIVVAGIGTTISIQQSLEIEWR